MSASRETLLANSAMARFIPLIQSVKPNTIYCLDVTFRNNESLEEEFCNIAYLPNTLNELPGPVTVTASIHALYPGRFKYSLRSIVGVIVVGGPPPPRRCCWLCCIRCC